MTYIIEGEGALVNPEWLSLAIPIFEKDFTCTMDFLV
jgi:hypothetical protein